MQLPYNKIKIFYHITKLSKNTLTMSQGNFEASNVTSNGVIDAIKVINNLPLSFPEKLELRNKYKETGSISDLIHLIETKPVQIFTTGQKEALDILKGMQKQQ